MADYKKAVEMFNAGLNCAQSVAAVYTGIFNVDESVIEAVSSGFGAGMGRLQKTCGAVTGAFMVLGLKNRNISSDIRKEKVYADVFEFEKRFKAKMNTSACDELLGCDLKTDAGKRKFEKEELKKNICEKCIITAIEILDEMI